ADVVFGYSISRWILLCRRLLRLLCLVSPLAVDLLGGRRLRLGGRLLVEVADEVAQHLSLFGGRVWQWRAVPLPGERFGGGREVAAKVQGGVRAEFAVALAAFQWRGACAKDVQSVGAERVC